MRTKNSIRNMVVALGWQLINFISGFAVRTVFIYTIGLEYLGVNGLFANILTVFSLADLGFGNAITYSLYRPIAEKDEDRIISLLSLYKKIYLVVGIMVALLGLVILPFLPILIKGNTNVPHIELIFGLFILNSVSSYFVAYKRSFIIAQQKEYVINGIGYYFIILMSLSQILILIYTKNYILVLIMQIIFGIIQNIVISKRADKMYPFIKRSSHSSIGKEERKEIFQNTYALFLFKAGGIVINSSTNIIISAFVGILWVGLYANYLIIINSLNSVIGIIYGSLIASVGNLNINGTEDRKETVFETLNFIYFWLYCFCSVCLWQLFNPFIDIWLGNQYLLPQYVVVLIIINFFTAGMQNACVIFRDASGLFQYWKYRPVVAITINIGLSIILIHYIGIAGVFVGPLVSRLATYVWYDPYIIYNKLINKNVIFYYIKYIKYVACTALCILITYILSAGLNENSFISFLLKLLICIFVSNTIIILFFRKTPEFKELYGIITQASPFLSSHN